MRNTQQIRGESGYAMAALLVAMALMALFMSIAMPVWKQAAQREKEEELVWRGQQYDRAIQLFRRKTSAPGAPNLDMLVNQRYLRRKYKDPITDKEFALKPLALAGVNMPPGVPQPPGMSQQPGSPQPPGPSQSPGSQQVPGGNGQLIGGVRSTSKAKSIRVLNGRDHYDQWEFVYTPYGSKIHIRWSGRTARHDPGAEPCGLPDWLRRQPKTWYDTTVPVANTIAIACAAAHSGAGAGAATRSSVTNSRALRPRELSAL